MNRGMGADASYRCAICNASGCKLWREYQTFHVRLTCARCSLIEQRKAGPLDPDGRREEDGDRTDTIGWLVPAVPAEEPRGAFWGYTSVPPDAVAWWRALPTYAVCASARWGQPGRHRRRKNRQEARALDAMRQAIRGERS